MGYKGLICFTFSILVGFTCRAQDLSCSLIKPESTSGYSMNVNRDLNLFVDDCFEKLGLIKPINLKVYEAPDVQNCFAAYKNQQLLLVFDVNWLNDIRNSDDWGSLFVIGHEIGHLIEGHVFRAHEKKFEFEADIWGARLLKSFGYPEDNFNNSLPDAFKLSKDSESHPDGLSRLKIINDELRKGKPRALSPFGLIDFEIDQWNLSDRKKIEALNHSSLILTQNVNKSTILNHAEHIVYCQDLIQEPEYILLELFAYGIAAGIVSPEEVAVYTRDIAKSKDSYKYATRIFQIFKSHENYKWFEEAIQVMSLQPLFRSLSNMAIEDESLSIYELDILAMFTLMMGHGSEHITEKEEKLIFEASKVSSIYNTEIEMISNMCILNNIIGDYSSAINWGLIQVKYWEDLSRRLPNSDKWSQEALGASMYTLGISYFRNGDYEKSKQTLIEGLEHSSNNETRANIHFFLARAYRKLGEYDIALVHIQKYDNENDPMYFRIYAQILIDLGQKEKAKTYLEIGCKLKDNWACTKLKFF